MDEESFNKLSEICNIVLQKFQKRLESIGNELAHVLRNELKKNGMLKRNISRFAIDNVLEEAKLDMGMGFAFADETKVPYKKTSCDKNCHNCTVYNIHEELKDSDPPFPISAKSEETQEETSDYKISKLDESTMVIE